MLQLEVYSLTHSLFRYSIMEGLLISQVLLVTRVLILVMGPATYTLPAWSCLEDSCSVPRATGITYRGKPSNKKPERSAYFRKQWFIETASCS